MRIGIVSYFYYPILNPRSFRAFELSKEFARLNHEVTVFIPDSDFDFTELEKKYKFKIKKVAPGFYLNKINRTNSKTVESNLSKVQTQKKTSLIKKIKRKLIQWFYPGGFNFEFSFTAKKALLKETKPFDLLISIGLPLCSHVAVSLAKKRNSNIAAMTVADYGDPYSFSKIIQPPFFHRWLERKMLKRFNFILTPTSNAIQSFTYFKREEFIKVIPQGFDFTNVKLANQSENKIEGEVQMIFAGNFYPAIREPKQLLEHLSKLSSNFKLILYVNTNDLDNLNLIEPYRELLKDKLEIRPFLPRLDCIYEMSKANFLINIANTEDAHTPSKLIDYCLSKKPIFSYVSGKFDPALFNRFLAGDYSQDVAKTIDVSEFDIRVIAKKILELKINS